MRRDCVAWGRLRESRWSKKGLAVDGLDRGSGKDIERLVGELN